MNSILVILLAMTSCTNIIKEDFVTVCKVSPDNVRIEYLDSANGIVSIEQQTIEDTLVLMIKVSTGVKNESKVIKLPKNNINYLRVGSRIFHMSNVQHCEEIRTGKDALEQFEK